MKKKLVALVTGLALLAMAGMAQATLVTIGTATYNSSDYNLIWDDDNNGNSVIWLDYSNDPASWSAQTAWAAGLDGQLTYNIDAQYNVSWDGAWRLGSTVDGQYKYGYEGPDGNGGYSYTSGYNLANSEMGHLYYEELGNLGYVATDGSYPQPGYGLTKTGDFDNLVASWYWSGTEYAARTDFAWFFHLDDGYLYYGYENYSGYGLALRSGQVSAADPIPEPGTMLLLSTGLVGLAGYGRKRRISG
jgi:hypothetical protein